MGWVVGPVPATVTMRNMTGDSSVDLAVGVEHEVAEWEKATAAVLRKSRRLAADAPDADVWSVLASTTLDGISVPPLGTPATSADVAPTGDPGQPPYTRGSGTADPALDGWDVRSWFTDPATTVDDVEAELTTGANSLWLTIGPAGIAPEALESLLEPVFLDLAPVVLDAADPATAARTLLAVIDAKAIEPHAGTNLGADPIGRAWRAETTRDLTVAVELAQSAQPIGIRSIVVDGTIAHDRGASDVQELAYTMLAAVTYLRALTEAGLDIDTAATQLDFRYAATDDQFATIAKFRAARALWSRVGELSGVGESARAQRQHAVTSRPMMARYDSYTNMLRTTVAAFAAGVGGADAVTVLPFDEPLGLPTPFSRRIARNTSSLLIHESHVAKVTDPAGGAHAVEKFTDDLALAAWELFGELDGLADLDRALATLDEAIAATRAERALLIATRKRPLTGVSEFPHLTETLPEREPYPVAPLVHRYAGEFEALRDEPAGQPVFLATMGTVAAHTARATFVSNLFAAGGVHLSVAGPTDGVEEVIERYREAGAPTVVCLAGTDADYQAWGPDLVTALRAAGASHVVVAGKADIGQDSSAAMGLDALAFLRQTREVLR